MSESYNGWSNRETWLVALWINNDQGWQEMVHETIRDAWMAGHISADQSWKAGEMIRENVEMIREESETATGASLFSDLLGTALARVDWDELGASFLRDVQEQDQ